MHSHFLWSENGKTSDRKIWKEKKQEIISEPETTLVSSQSPISIPLTLPAWLAKIWVISPVSTVTRRVTMQQSFPNLREEEAILREAQKDSTPVTNVKVSSTYKKTWKDLGQVIQWWWKGIPLKKLFQTQERRLRRGYPGTSSLHLIPGSILEKWMTVTIAMTVSITRMVTIAMTISIARTVIIIMTVLMATKVTIAKTSFLLQNKLRKYKYNVCRKGVCLENLSSCRQPSK